MAVFGLVHLSDLHFADSPNRLPSPVQNGGLAALIEAVIQGHRGNWFRSASHSTRAARSLSRFLATKLIPAGDVDALVITGDLATTGSRSDLRAAFDYISHAGDDWVTEQDEPRLVSDGLPIQLLAGNHDRYKGATLLPGCENFEEVLSHLWIPHAVCDRLSEPLILHKDGEALAVLAADFSFRSLDDSRSTATGFIGRGLVCEQTLRALREVTLSLNQAGHAVIWAVHFPPRFPGGDENLALENDDRLLETAIECGINIILAGHTHVEKIYEVDGVHVCCTGSATQQESDSPFHFGLLRLEVTSGHIQQASVSPFRYIKAGVNNFSPGQDVPVI